MIPFSLPTFDDKEIKAVKKVIKSNWLAAGKVTEEFEKKFAEYVNVKYAIFTNSGTAALKMAYKYMKEEMLIDKVTIPRNTFCATYSAAAEMGFNVQDDAGLWSWKEFLPVTVHYGGVKDLTATFLEDSAHRIEKNDPLVGKIRIYSFYVTKNMTTGAGGMLVTNDKKIYEKCRLYWKDGIDKSTYQRQHGGWDYKVVEMSGGYDGNDLAAAIGLVQLKKLPKFTRQRNAIRDIYNEVLDQDWRGNHLYPYFVENEKEVGSLIEYLKNKGIQAGYHYPGTGWLGVSLPIYPRLSWYDTSHIINTIFKWRYK